MSRKAIAAVLAGDDLSGGERLVALSPASSRTGRTGHGRVRRRRVLGVAVPRAAGAARPSRARGGRRARDRRGRASRVRLVFAETGRGGTGTSMPSWWRLSLAVAAPRAARLLLATMAAVADEDGVDAACPRSNRAWLPA